MTIALYRATLFARQFFQYCFQFFQFRTAFAMRTAADLAAFASWITFSHDYRIFACVNNYDE